MRYLCAGESHGPCLTAIIEGLPSGLELYAKDLNRQLQRRQQGYGRGARMSIEKDQILILSGLRFNRLIGSPLTLQIKNRDWVNWQKIMAPEGDKPSDMTTLTRPRPGHADLAGGLKYDHTDLRLVLERSSARETAIRVAVGSVARVLLDRYGISIFSHVLSIGTKRANVRAEEVPGKAGLIEKSPLRCACPETEKAMLEEIVKAKEDGDTLGGIFEVIVTGIPPGLGSHVHYDRRLDGRIAGALMGIQAIKGVEIGAGFAGAVLPGSQHHDPIVIEAEKGISRSANRAGGIEGGVTNGQPLLLRAAMKPIPTLVRPLPSVDLKDGFASEGVIERSDTCAVPAAAVVAEAVVAWEVAVAFREKFAGDFIEEVDAAFNYYMQKVNKRLRKNDADQDQA
jgi:chorismate synthase